LVNNFFLPYIALISVFTSHMVLQGSFHDSSLYSPPGQVTLWFRIIPACQIQRGGNQGGKTFVKSYPNRGPLAPQATARTTAPSFLRQCGDLIMQISDQFLPRMEKIMKTLGKTNRNNYQITYQNGLPLILGLNL